MISYYFNPILITNDTFIEATPLVEHTFYTISKYPNPESLDSNTESIKIKNKKYYLYSKTKIKS